MSIPLLCKITRNVKKIDPNATLGILDCKVSDCLFKVKGGCGASALHPFWRNIDLSADELAGYTVRAWMSGHLYPEKSTGVKLDFAPLEAQESQISF